MKTVTISEEEYKKLKKKAEVADDVITQLEKSLLDAESGRVRKAIH